MANARERNGRKSKWDTPAPSTGGATEAAHEAARKLNAMLAAKGKLSTNAPPPLLPPGPRSTAGPNKGSNTSSEIFTEEIEINDSPQRLVLCKGTVQFEISKYSGASISTKGQYIPPSEKEQFVGQKPLHLFIQSSTKEQVNLAVQRIQGILHGDDPYATLPPPPNNFQQNQPSLPSGMHYVQEKIFVGLDNVPPEFNLKEKIMGPGESYFNHITRETGAKIQLRGRGSGFIEPTSGREAFEALYIYISHNTYPGLGAAKKLVENLIQTVRNAFQTFQMQQHSNNFSSGYRDHGSQQPHHPPPPNIYNMPPHLQRYGAPSHPNGSQSYPPYPHPPSQYPPRYNQPPQPRPDYNQFHHGNQPAPPQGFYPNQTTSYPEGPRPLMNELVTRPPHVNHPPREHGGYHAYPPHQEPQQFNNSNAEHQPSYKSEMERKLSNHVEDERPANETRKRRFTEAKSLPNSSSGFSEEKETSDIDPPKRRFTEVPVRQPNSNQPASNPAQEKQRSVYSLDRPSSSFSSSTQQPPKDDVFTMPAPLPVPKTKTANIVKDNLPSGSFKAPLLPVRAAASAIRKNVPAVTEKKDEEPEKKSTGFALLGNYDDFSDEDD